MTKFEKLFGMATKDVKENCVLAPMINKEIIAGLGIKKITRGRLYGSADMKAATFIHTGMSAALVGDAVLYLKETACKNLYLFGSCGSTGALDVGMIVAPSVSYADESFSAALYKKNEIPAFYPDKVLFEKLIQGNGLRKVVCQTIASLKLEEDRAELFRSRGVDVVDMECSAFFSAAAYSGLRALALFYVSDVISKKLFYEPLLLKERKVVEGSIKTGAGILCRNLSSLPGF